MPSSDPGPNSAGQVRVPTSGLLLVIAGGGVLHLLGRATDGGWLALGSAVVLVLPLVAKLLAPDLRTLKAVRSGPARAAVGDEIACVLQLSNDGRRTTAPVRVRDELPGYAPVTVLFPALRPGERREVTVLRTALHRVSAPNGSLALEAVSPVGLLTAKRVHPLSGWVVVHPARVPGPALHGAGGRAQEPSLLTGKAVPGLGTELLGLREWRAGESPRAVSARATARHGRPLVLERERDSALQLVILVGHGEGPRWEARLAEAMDAALRAAGTGRPPTVLGLPAHPPSLVRDAFAAADQAARLEAPALHAALAQAGPGGTLVIVSGSVPPDVVAPQLRPAAAALRCRMVVLDG